MKKISLETLTGEEFKALIEQFTDNGKVDTIPELMERIGEVPDDMTLADWIREQAEQSAIDEETLKRLIGEELDEAIAEDIITRDDRVTQEELDEFEV